MGRHSAPGMLRYSTASDDYHGAHAEEPGLATDASEDVITADAAQEESG